MSFQAKVDLVYDTLGNRMWDDDERLALAHEIVVRLDGLQSELMGGDDAVQGGARSPVLSDD